MSKTTRQLVGVAISEAIDGFVLPCEPAYSAELKRTVLARVDEIMQGAEDKPKVKPHLYRQTVNALADIAREYGQTQQLRERLNNRLALLVEPDHAALGKSLERQQWERFVIESTRELLRTNDKFQCTGVTQKLLKLFSNEPLG